MPTAVQRLSFRLATSLVALLLGIASTLAQGKIYLKLEGIEGESTSQSHPKWIEIQTFSNEHSKPAETNRPAFPGLTLQKAIDRSSGFLARNCATGRSIPSATLEFIQLFDRELVLYKIQLENVTLRNYAVDGGPESKPLDSFTLAFRRISWTVTHYNNQGAKLGDYDAYWDLARNTGDSSPLPLAIAIDEAGSSQWRISWQGSAGLSYRLLGSPVVQGPYFPLINTTATQNGLQEQFLPRTTAIQFFKLQTVP